MRSRLLPLLALLLPAGLAACGGAGPAVDPGPALPEFKVGVDSAWLPMVFGATSLFEGTSDGLRLREEVHALESPRTILRVPCLGLRKEVYLDGELVEIGTEWYAEDREGNVWCFGDEALELDGRAFGRSPDSWIAGTGDAVPFLALPADPVVGQELWAYGPRGGDFLRVLSVSETVVTPAGTFTGCLAMEAESVEDVEDVDVILYAPGVGRVAESSPGSEVVLVARRGP